MNSIINAKPERLDVHFYVTPVCNLSCPHCYYDALTRRSTPPNEVTYDEVRSVLETLCRNFDADISLEGGEVFLRKGMDGFLESLPLEVLHTLTLTTNGTLPIQTSDETLRALRSLRISIDGHTDELQKELRGVSLGVVLRTCRSLSQRSVPYTVRTTLWKRNVDDVQDVLDWSAAQGFDSLSLFEFQASGRGVSTDLLYGVDDAQFERLLANLKRLRVPGTIRQLTLNLNDSRVESVLEAAPDLAEAGFLVRDLPWVPNTTFNYDGSVGISPWRITAHGAPDVFTSIHDPSYLEQITRAVEDGRLMDTSGCISRVQLVHQGRETS